MNIEQIPVKTTGNLVDQVMEDLSQDKIQNLLWNYKENYPNTD